MMIIKKSDAAKAYREIEKVLEENKKNNIKSIMSHCDDKIETLKLILEVINEYDKRLDDWQQLCHVGKYDEVNIGLNDFNALYEQVFGKSPSDHK